MLLQSRRLCFCPWGAGDLALLAALHGDPEVQRHLERGSVPWTADILQAKLDRYRADYAAHGWTKFKLLDLDGSFVGRAGFSRFAQTDELELGYSLTPPHWNRGLATEAARFLLGWIYGVAAVDHVIGFAAVANAGSRRVLEKAGMSFTGIRDLHGSPNAFYMHRRGSSADVVSAATRRSI